MIARRLFATHIVSDVIHTSSATAIGGRAGRVKVSRALFSYSFSKLFV
jgi:hypothetical protein